MHHSPSLPTLNGGASPEKSQDAALVPLQIHDIQPPQDPVSPIHHPPIFHHFAAACPALTSHLQEIDALASYFIGEKTSHQA